MSMSIQHPILRSGRELTSPQTGQTYKIDGPIGSGGFGCAYLATSRGKTVVVKVSYDQGSWVRELYFGELLKKVEGILHIIEGFPLPRPDASGRLPYALVIEDAPGATLRDFLLDDSVRLREGRIVTMFKRIAGALDHVHAGGGLHRDLTPQNIFLDDRDRSLIGDFGIAKHRGRRRGVAADALNPWYAPPEVHSTTWQWTAEQDIWQVGQLLAATIRRAPDETIQAKDVRHLDCSDWLREVVFRSIGPHTVRFRSAGELKRALIDQTEAINTLPKARPTSLAGKSIVFTARLPDSVRAEATRRAKRAGATITPKVTPRTDYLVLGDSAPLYGGGTAGSKLIRAIHLNEEGANIRIIRSSRFDTLL